MSSNTRAGGNPPRLARNDARHTINNNQAQARSNHSAPDLRHHLNDKRAEATRNNNDDDDDVGPRCFGPAVGGILSGLTRSPMRLTLLARTKAHLGASPVLNRHKGKDLEDISRRT